MIRVARTLAGFAAGALVGFAFAGPDLWAMALFAVVVGAGTWWNEGRAA